MEETTLTLKQLEDKIINKHKIYDNLFTNTRRYAIRAILYAIVTVWIRFFKDNDNDNYINDLFKSLPDKNEHDVAFIKTLLKQYKKNETDSSRSAVEFVANCARAESDAADSTLKLARAKYTRVKSARAKYARNKSTCAVYSAAHAAHVAEYAAVSDTHSGVEYSVASIARAACAADSAAHAACAAYTYSVVEYSASERALLYLISAYIYLKI